MWLSEIWELEYNKNWINVINKIFSIIRLKFHCISFTGELNLQSTIMERVHDITKYSVIANQAMILSLQIFPIENSPANSLS